MRTCPVRTLVSVIVVAAIAAPWASSTVPKMEAVSRVWHQAAPVSDSRTIVRCSISRYPQVGSSLPGSKQSVHPACVATVARVAQRDHRYEHSLEVGRYWEGPATPEYSAQSSGQNGQTPLD